MCLTKNLEVVCIGRKKKEFVLRRRKLKNSVYGGK